MVGIGLVQNGFGVGDMGARCCPTLGIAGVEDIVVLDGGVI